MRGQLDKFYIMIAWQRLITESVMNVSKIERSYEMRTEVIIGSGSMWVSGNLDKNHFNGVNTRVLLKELRREWKVEKQSDF